ncbi:MAG TPA: DUF4159 domain-containing protein [Bauldia sp.]|nr:DUF4159 domain-containing protein [Bauldia sp.]
MGAFAFANAGMLLALVALPVIWYFLRLMPPKPRLEQFPPTRLLLEIARKEEQPARSPWWLTALRLLLAAAVIFALAGPVFKTTGEVAPGQGPLLLVVDNGWASAPQWKAMVATAHRVVDLAAEQNRPIALLATAEPPSQSLAPTDSGEIARRIDALVPRPWTPDYAALTPAVGAAAKATPFGGTAWLSEGLGGAATDAFAAAITADVNGPLLAYVDTSGDLFALKPPVGTADALNVPVIRREASLAAGGVVRASDIRGRVIGETPFTFAAGKTDAEAKFVLPVELRNDIVRLEVTGSDTAGAVQLLDDRWRRRQVGLLSGASVEAAQPLLSPLYYISRAVQPFADVREPRDANADVAIPQLIDGGASLIVMADIGNLTADAEDRVTKWVENGGTLVRFAGPRLAAATDKLIPVTLRHGDRVLGGSMSWQTPQPLASFSDKSPFAGLAVPDDIVVRRQVLAEPDGALADRTWAALADGTPLVTATQSGKGWLVLFHVTADTSWSNLPLSGTFVEMLRRIIAFSANAGAGTETAATPLAAYRLLDGAGHFIAPTADAESLAGDLSKVSINIQHPPGLYGSEDGFRALNLLDANATLAPFAIPPSAQTTVRNYPTAAPTVLSPWLLALAAALLGLDALAVLWLNGGVRWRPRRAAGATAAALVAALMLFAPSGRGDAAEPNDTFALSAMDKTHLAYVITGDAQVDETSRAGLVGLSDELAARTALEPGDPIGVDPATDELAFFPLIYWPIVPSTAAPAPATMAKIDAYMRQGGSVLFDTRDQLERSVQVSGFGGTPAADRLREMLSGLDIPPLEPVPADHVLTKAFYLLNDFPGRYAGGPLWVQATDTSEERADRPAQAGDGVSTILITENDFAGAWAVDADRTFLYPTVPSDPLQREMAYRTGINIVMYTLTGNYKADQVHVPALLERLGQ